MVKDGDVNDDECVKKEQEFVVKSVLDTGCGKFLVRTEVCHTNGWVPRKLLPSQVPDLCNPDGSPLKVAGYVNIWLRLPNEAKPRKQRAFVVDNLQNKMLIGLPVLRAMRWIPRDWPENIGGSSWRWSSSSGSSEEEDEDGGRFTVNAVAEWHEREAKERRSRDMRRRSHRKTTTAPLVEVTSEGEESIDCQEVEGVAEEELEYLNALLERTDYKQIPGFDKLPEELQEAVKDYKMQFSNTMKRGDAMKVKPAKFKLKKNYVVPEQRGGVQLPPIHMRPACDKLMDELEDAEVIEPSPPDNFLRGQYFCRSMGTHLRFGWQLITSDLV